MMARLLVSFSKKTAITVIVFSLLLSPFSYVKAQSSFLSGSGSFGGVANAAFTCSGIGDKINSAISDIFSTGSSTSGALGGTADTSASGSAPPGETGQELTGLQSEQGTLLSQAVPTDDKPSQKGVDQDKAKACADAVAYALAKAALAELTKSTVNWINSGFKGSPTYVQEPASFLKSIGDAELSGIISIIGFDPLNYPYGQAVAQSLISQTQGYFEANARFSLDQIIAMNNPGMTSANFYADFNVGGWGAWLGSIIFPQNNPIGFQFQAENALAARTSGIDYSPIQDARDQIARSGGFLDLRKCVSPDTYNNSSEEIVADMQNQLKNPSQPLSAEEIAGIQYTIKQNTCVRWETQTPGSILAATATKALDSNFDQLALADSVNESLAAVFDALFNQLVGYGLRSLSTNDTSQSSISSNFLGGFGSNISTFGSGDLGGNQGWFSFQQQDINLLDDLPALMDIQRKYLGQPTLGTDPMPEFGGIPEVIKTIGTVAHDIELLDYCIPGPRPTWQTTTQQFVTETINQMIEEAATGQHKKLKLGLPGITQYVNFWVKTFNWIFGDSNAARAKKATALENAMTEAFEEYSARITGVPLVTDVGNTHVQIDTIGYTSANLPLVTAQATQEYFKGINYVKVVIPGLETAMENLTITLQKLQYIYDQVVALNDPSNNYSSTYIEAQTQVLTDAFNGLTSWMGSPEGLTQIKAANDLYNEEHLYVVSLLQQCSTQINDPSYRATLGANGLDNWVNYPGIFQFNTSSTGDIIDPTKPANAWLFENPHPYTGVTLPYPIFKSPQGPNTGPNGSCTDPGGLCWMTFLPSTQYSTAPGLIPNQGWYPVFLIGKDPDVVNADIFNLKDWFAQFEEAFGIY